MLFTISNMKFREKALAQKFAFTPGKFLFIFGLFVIQFSHRFWLHRSPETSKIRSKMLYASSKDAIRKKLVGISNEIQGTDFSEVAFQTVLDTLESSTFNSDTRQIILHYT